MRIFLCIVLFIIALAGALIANMPMSFLANVSGLKSEEVYYSRAVGTIWNGGFSDVHIKGEVLGQVNIKLMPLSVLKLSPTAHFQFDGAVGNGKGKVSVGLDKVVSIRELIARIHLNAFKHLDVQLRRSPSTLNLSVPLVRISSTGQCREANGGLKSDLLTAVGRAWAWDGPEINGRISCQGEDYHILLSNTAGPDKLEALAVLKSDLTYEVESNVTTRNGRLSNALISFGFEGQSQQGHFRYARTSADFAAQQ
ncbi:type II secretion system protein N [Hirschia maritima]|uniref:type II secretion system protein N n=1 Tax=Hirschia maritima TaxID=1121961 RepID=UPI000366D8A5|nr:type II secretion system protein N [Hirschia maritima]